MNLLQYKLSVTMKIEDKFIADLSNELDFLIDEIDWEFMENKYDLKGCLGDYGDDGIFYHFGSLEWIINNSFNYNPKKCIEMFEYICYKYKNDFDFSEVKNYINLEEKEINFEFKEMDFQNLRVFISYSSNDFEEANRIYNIFKNTNINCFLASKEIKLGENWDERIFEELINADIFIFLLSESYKESFWCNQESSIAYLKRELHNSVIIPLLTDSVYPYGIFYKIQGISSNQINTIHDFSQFINQDAISFESAINFEHQNKLKEIDEFIDELSDVTNFHDSNKIFDKLKFLKLEFYQVKKVFDYALLNDQVSGSFGFDYFLRKYYGKYAEELDSKRYNKIKSWYEQILEN